MRPSDRASLTTTVRRAQSASRVTNKGAVKLHAVTPVHELHHALPLLRPGAWWMTWFCPNVSGHAQGILRAAVYRPPALANGGPGERGATAARSGEGRRASGAAWNQQSRHRLCGWRHQAITAGPEDDQTSVSPHHQCSLRHSRLHPISNLQTLVCAAAHLSAHLQVFTHCAPSRRWNGSIAQPPSQDSMQAARATVRDSVHGFRRSHGGWASNTPQCARWCLLVLMCVSCVIDCSRWHTISTGRLTCAMQSQPHVRDLFGHCRAARTAAAQPQPWPKQQPQPQPAARAKAARASAATSAASSTDGHPAAAADPEPVRRAAVQEVVSASGMGCGLALALQGAPLAPGNHWTTRYRRLIWQQQGTDNCLISQAMLLAAQG